MGTISLLSSLRYSAPGSKTLYTRTVAVLADQRATRGRTLGITHRWILTDVAGVHGVHEPDGHVGLVLPDTRAAEVPDGLGVDRRRR